MPGVKLRKFDIFSALVGFSVIVGSWFAADIVQVIAVAFVGAIVLVAGGLFAGIIRA